MSGKIRTKVLRVILSTSLGALVLLSVTVMVSIFNIRNTTLAQSDQLGAEAARSSQVALEAQVRQQIISLAEDKAALADEKLTTIQNQTKMVADIASHIFTYRAQYSPRRIDYLQVGQEGTVPHLSSAPGFSLPEFRNEVYLAANVSDMLRQMMVVDIGIMGSYIGTEDGYSIVVERDAYPNETDYDARTRGWYKGARDAGGIFWTDIFTDAVSKQAAISCAMPFYDLSGGRRVFKGVAGNGTLLSASVNKIIDSTKIGETGYAFVLNAKGQVIFTPKSADMITDEAGNIIGEDYLNSTNPAIRELAQRMLSRESGIM
ncbi:MAG: hypothetical protein LBQ30_11195, partial [Treponema sp.]|nr:hypothetical protein [Treponema sp.]